MDERVELVPIKFKKVLQAKNYTSVILGTDEKDFSIYTTPKHGKILQKQLVSSTFPRPMTHELILALFRGLDVKLKQVVIYSFKDNIFEARLFIEQECGETLNIVEVDARPSDCIALALSQKVPLYCTKEVLDNAMAFAEA
jgi:uncharacterized protein